MDPTEEEYRGVKIVIIQSATTMRLPTGTPRSQEIRLRFTLNGYPVQELQAKYGALFDMPLSVEASRRAQVISDARDKVLSGLHRYIDDVREREASAPWLL